MKFAGGRGDDGQEGFLRDAGRIQDRDRRRIEVGLPQGGDAVPSRPASGRQAGRGPLQGNQRGLPAPVGRAETRRLRPLRPCRLRAGRHERRVRRLDVGYLRGPVRRHDGRPARPGSPAAASAAPTCATISRSPSRRPSAARPQRSSCRRRWSARPVPAPGRGRARSPQPARPARATDACARSRASSPSNAPVRPVTDAARRSTILVTNAPAPGA